VTAAGGADLRPALLLAATFVVAVAALVYELVAGAAASYLLGDSVTQFSLVIGLFLSAMGVGAFLSRFVDDAQAGFTASQILLGVVGGFSAPLLFATYAYLEGLSGVLFALVFACGALSGLEIPLITRILGDLRADGHTLANVLTADYLGALVAALAFPLLIVPQLGLMSASLAFGLMNLLVAGLSLWLFRTRLRWRFRAVWAVAVIACGLALVRAEALVSVLDAALFEDEVVYAETTPYQRITITRFADRTRLYLNGSIQFDSLDEHRYHEMLVHPALSRVPRPQRVLILGGGDGMAAREVLLDARVEHIDLVDIDPRVTTLFRDRDDLAALNGGALRDPRVTLHHVDAWTYVDQRADMYDLIIADLPDPHDFALSKLYSLEFYAKLVDRLSTGGLIVTQAGSPLFARQAFWSIRETLAQTRNPQAPGEVLWTEPLQVTVPSFGVWGFVVAAPLTPAARDLQFPDALGYLTPQTYRNATVFAPDVSPDPVEPNSIQTHVLTRYYADGWARWFE
jgi:spermidine synthase